MVWGPNQWTSLLCFVFLLLSFAETSRESLVRVLYDAAAVMDPEKEVFAP